MSTFIKVKRKLCEDPLPGLYISASKKAKMEDKEPILFKYCGTFKSKDALTSDQLKECQSKQQPQLMESKRKIEAADGAQQLHKIQKVELEEDDIELYNLDSIDAALQTKKPERQAIACNGAPLVRVEENDSEDSLYDLYVGPRTQIIMENEQTCIVDGYLSNLRLNHYEESDHAEDSEDSNAENHWRNDYPDEDEEFVDGREEDSEDEQILDEFEDLHISSTTRRYHHPRLFDDSDDEREYDEAEDCELD